MVDETSNELQDGPTVPLRPPLEPRRQSLGNGRPALDGRRALDVLSGVGGANRPDNRIRSGELRGATAETDIRMALILEHAPRLLGLSRRLASAIARLRWTCR